MLHAKARRQFVTYARIHTHIQYKATQTFMALKYCCSDGYTHFFAPVGWCLGVMSLWDRGRVWGLGLWLCVCQSGSQSVRQSGPFSIHKHIHTITDLENARDLPLRRELHALRRLGRLRVEPLVVEGVQGPCCCCCCRAGALAVVDRATAAAAAAVSLRLLPRCAPQPEEGRDGAGQPAAQRRRRGGGGGGLLGFV